MNQVHPQPTSERNATEAGWGMDGEAASTRGGVGDTAPASASGPALESRMSDATSSGAGGDSEKGSIAYGEATVPAQGWGSDSVPAPQLSLVDDSQGLESHSDQVQAAVQAMTELHDAAANDVRKRSDISEAERQRLLGEMHRKMSAVKEFLEKVRGEQVAAASGQTTRLRTVGQDRYYEGVGGGGSEGQKTLTAERVEHWAMTASGQQQQHQHARPDGPEGGLPEDPSSKIPVTEMTARRQLQPDAGGAGGEPQHGQGLDKSAEHHQLPPHGAHTPPLPDEQVGGMPRSKAGGTGASDSGASQDDKMPLPPDTNRGVPPQTPVGTNTLEQPERGKINWPSRSIERDSRLLKQAVEAVVSKRVSRRKKSGMDFMKSSAALAVYLAFLGILTALLVLAPTVQDIAMHKQAMEAALSSSSPVSSTIPSSPSGSNVAAPAAYTLAHVSSVEDMYTYVSSVLLPASYHMANATRLPHLANGANMLLRPFVIKQLRVRPEGDVFPAFSIDTQETRDGGGTWQSADPEGTRPDWPVRAEWVPYTNCVVGLKEACFVDDGRAIKGGDYIAGGYMVSLPLSSASAASEKVREMRVGSYADMHSTRAIFVQGVVSLMYKKLLCTTTVLFEVLEGGYVSPTLKVRVADLKSSEDPSWFSLSAALVALAAVLSLAEIYSLIFGTRPYLSSGWTYLSWCNYTSVFVWFWLRITNLPLEIEAHNLMKESEAPIGDSAFPFHEVLWRHELAHTTLGLSAVLSYVRLLGFLEPLSPSTRRLIAVLKHASRPLGPSLAFLASTVAGGCLALISCLGRSYPAFSTPSSSLSSLLLLATGSLDSNPLFSEFPLQLPPIIAILLLAAITFAILLVASSVQGADGDAKEWTDDGSQIVTLDRVVSSRSVSVSCVHPYHTLTLPKLLKCLIRKFSFVVHAGLNSCGG